MKTEKKPFHTKTIISTKTSIIIVITVSKGHPAVWGCQLANTTVFTQSSVISPITDNI